jgi:Carboxypeptidase regulatory-like domain
MRTDPAGGALVGAKIQVTNAGTNVAQTTVTDGQGRYKVADLPIGTCDIQASLARFQTVTQEGVTLAVGAHPLVDFAGFPPQFETSCFAWSSCSAADGIQSDVSINDCADKT